MPVLGIDDTDSREKGMCTTFIGAEIVSAIEEHGYEVGDVYLFRLNPAAKHKTRGNACVAIETEMPASESVAVAKEVVAEHAVVEDERTHPGIVAADETPDELAGYTYSAVRELIDLETAEQLIDEYELEFASFGVGRGRIGALAALSVPQVLSEGDSTYELISYRELPRCGSEREVDIDSVFEAANEWYPEAWDTVDRATGQAVCIPNAPGPILYGIRGDSKEAVWGVTKGIESESVSTRQLFETNQGTDMHLQEANSLAELTDNSAYRVTGTVTAETEFKQGGHVHFSISDGAEEVTCIAFKPTDRFRTEVVGNLKVGDKVTVCGEVGRGNLKLEKLRLDRVRQRTISTPLCEECSIQMKSQGANQGYKCKRCGAVAGSKSVEPIERQLELGWYEVPPCARRHIAKPLIRGGFDAPTHPYK